MTLEITVIKGKYTYSAVLTIIILRIEIRKYQT